MKTKIFALSLLIFSALVLNSQTPSWQWAKRVGSFNDNPPFSFGEQNERFNDVKTDKQGNVYAVGAFFQNSAFDNQTTGFPTTGGYGGRDAYLFKFNKCGKTLWWRRMGGTGNDIAKSLVLDNNGHVIIAVESPSSTYTIGDGVHDTTINNGYSSIYLPTFLAKYDTAGHFINANIYPYFSNTNNFGLLKIFANSQGNFVLTNGELSYTIPPTLGTIISTYTYAANAPYWLPEIRGAALDKNDNLYLCGSFGNTINIGSGTILIPPIYNSSISSYMNSSLIMKFTPQGILQWYKVGANTGSGDVLYNCVTDTSSTVLATGGIATSNTTVFGYAVNAPPPSPSYGGYANVIFFLSANTGSLLSAVTGTTPGLAMIAPSFTDRDNIIYCAGTIGGYLAFNTTTFTSNPTNALQNCISKFDVAGNFINTNLLPQSGSSPSTINEAVNGIDVDEQGNIYLAGMFGGTLDSLGTAVNIIGGSEDGFVAKYGFACNSNSTNLSPLPPTSLTAQYQAILTNHVTWIDNANYETAYELWCSANGGAYALLSTLPANTTTYTHTGLSYNSNYCYKARAINNTGPSVFTNIGCAATPTTTGTAPNTPLALTATNNGSLTNNVAWTDNSPNEDNFELHYTIGSATNYSLLATLPANTTSYAHTGLSYTTTYCYKVAATNTTGTSAFSNTACATTPAAPNSTIGIAEQNLLNSLSVYPNPTSGEITLHFVSTGSKTKVEVFDLTGKIVYTEIINTTQGENTRKFNLPKEKGLYAVKLSSEQAVVTRKIIVE